MNGKKKVAHGYHKLWHNCEKMAITWCRSSLPWTYAIPKTWPQKKQKENIGRKKSGVCREGLLNRWLEWKEWRQGRGLSITCECSYIGKTEAGRVDNGRTLLIVQDLTSWVCAAGVWHWVGGRQVGKREKKKQKKKRTEQNRKKSRTKSLFDNTSKNMSDSSRSAIRVLV